MNLLTENIQIVMDYLSDNNATKTTCALHRECYKRLESHFKEKGKGFSCEEADAWCEDLSLCRVTIRKYKGAIQRLVDVFQTGKVRFCHRIRITLDDQYENVISAYLSHASALYSDTHLMNIRRRCRFFFTYVQLEKENCPPDRIDYKAVADFSREALPDLSDPDVSMYKGSIRELLAWMAAKGMCSPGLAIIFRPGTSEKILYPEDLSEDTTRTIQKIGKATLHDFPSEEFYAAGDDFCKGLEDLGYARSEMLTAGMAMDLLYVFLDMNHLDYSPAIAKEWLKAASALLGTYYRGIRRILSLFEIFTEGGSVVADVYIFYGRKLIDTLPEWCRRPLTAFLDLKKREGKAPATVDMYRSSCTRFCLFLTEEGISSFHELTADLIKAFNLWDRHKTIEGKNAYNVRIRKFLLYLSEKELVKNRFLADSLPCSAAPKVRDVKIFSEKDADTLERYECEPDRAMFLRDRAIILLGLRMGIRISDILILELSQIDWANGTIHFCQKKTSVEKILPMPVEVGNALFLYLTEGRPKVQRRYVFIAHKAPYQKINRGVGSKIIKKAFFDRGNEMPGFHSVRKTYATGRFRSSCSYSEVADLLGHTSTETVHKYISLDEERMRLCPISLEEAGISMKGGFRRG